MKWNLLKTRVVKFGRFAVQNAKAKGDRLETFGFLGLTHHCGTKWDGKGFRMKRKTARNSFGVDQSNLLK